MNFRKSDFPYILIFPKLITDTWWIQIANISMGMKAVLNVIKVRFFAILATFGLFGLLLGSFWANLAML